MNSPFYIPNWQYHSRKDTKLDFIREENMLRRALHRGKTIIKRLRHSERKMYAH